jgi:haloalkane dehalogenase
VISDGFPSESQYVDVRGSRMHYVEQGTGSPILFLHGNPTSSYLWRNIIPFAVPYGRAVAVDLIGMGRSDKPDLAYRFFDHFDYLDDFIEALDLVDLTLVVHDWGSALGFHHATRHPGRVKRIAFMDAIVEPMRWKDTPAPLAWLFKRFRDPVKGHRMNGEKNFFVKRLLPMMASRCLTAAQKAAYAAPYADVASRKPVEQWPREIPFDDEPADMAAVVTTYNAWLRRSPIPKLFLWAKPGAIIRGEKAAARIGVMFRTRSRCSSARVATTSRKTSRTPSTQRSSPGSVEPAEPPLSSAAWNSSSSATVSRTAASPDRPGPTLLSPRLAVSKPN